MIINAIRYKPFEGDEVYLRFGKANGAFRNFVSYLGSEAELEAFAKALSFSLTGQPLGDFTQSSLNLKKAQKL